jgi:hypothetical protein
MSRDFHKVTIPHHALNLNIVVLTIMLHTTHTNTSPENQFDKLVIALKDALGSSGLTSDNIDIKLLTRLMQEYWSNEDEWRRFALVDPNSGYTRNLIDKGNGNSNLVSPQSKDVCLTEADPLSVASTRLDARQRQPYPQPQRCTLSDEDSVRSAH